MILVIDNYDSFTYNLVQYIGEVTEDVQVFRNNEVTVEEARRLAPEKIVVSPGPCTPLEAGVSNDIIREMGGGTPTLGVCLGHQCLGHVFGGRVIGAPRLMHGKTSQIFHYGDPLFAGIESPFEATRYHSLIVERDTLPECLVITAETDRKEIMGLKHRDLPIWGVQFHPESILTAPGKRIMRNFLAL